MFDISVIIPAHNPRCDYLARVLDALHAQSLPRQRWELLLVDNKSDRALNDLVALEWHENGIVIREENLGLTQARIRGFRESSGRIIIFVDDDNVLAADYLENALSIVHEYPFIGAWGGNIDPEFEQPRLAPPREFNSLLTLREVRVDLWSNDPNHHGSTPWGAGICIRREVADAYVRELSENRTRASLDLRGKLLLYGGDTDISYTGCRLGFGKGVFSRLRVTHLIPATRCTAGYLCSVAQGRGYSEVLHGYALSGTVPVLDRFNFSQALRYVRTLLKPRLQRSIAFSHEQGRRRALCDLCRGG